MCYSFFLEVTLIISSKKLKIVAKIFNCILGWLTLKNALEFKNEISSTLWRMLDLQIISAGSGWEYYPTRRVTRVKFIFNLVKE